MDSMIHFPTMYSAMIESIINSKTYSNAGTNGTVYNYIEDLSNNNNQEKSEDCKLFKNSFCGNYFSKRKNLYYFPLTALLNTPNATEIRKIYTNLCANQIAKATVLSFNCDAERVSECSLKEKISNNAAKFSDWKKNYQSVLPLGNAFSANRSCISEKEFLLNEEFRENYSLPKTSFIYSLLSVLYQYYLKLSIAPENFSHLPKAFPGKSEMDGFYHINNLNFQVKIPKAAFDVTGFEHGIDDGIYEYQSFIKDIKKRPCDNLLKRTSCEEFEFNSETNDSQDELFRQPLLTCLRTQYNSHFSKDDFCNESDWSQVDDAFLVDPIFLDEGFHRQESSIIEDTKELSWDTLCNGSTMDEIEYDSETTDSQEKLLRSPFLSSFSTCNPHSSKEYFCGESDLSLIDDAFSVNPIDYEEDFDAEESNSEVKLPKATFDETNFKHEMDDETYEYLSIFEDDGEDSKERPRDTLLKRTSDEEFQFDYEAGDYREGLLRSPFLSCFSTCNPHLSKDDFRDESEWSLVNEAFLVHPIDREGDFDAQKSNSEIKISEPTLDETHFKHETDYYNYEYLPIFEDDDEENKERPRDTLLKIASGEEFEFDYEASDSREGLLRSPLLKCLGTFNPHFSTDDFCNESEWSLVDDAFLVDPNECEEDFDAKESNAEVKIPKATFAETYFKHEMDDDTYEYLSIFEDDGEERPRDNLLNGTSEEEFEFDSQASDFQAELLRSPLLGSSSTYYPHSNNIDLCDESDWSVVDDAF